MTGLFHGLLLIFFFLMLVFPATYQIERGVLLAVLVAGGILCALHGSWTISRTIVLWSLVTVTAGLLFMWNGAIHGAPGALRVGTVHVLWPLLYLFFIGFLRESATLEDLQKTIIIGMLASAIMGILLVIGTIAGHGAMLAERLPTLDLSAGMYDGFARYRLSNIPTVVYGAGFLLTLLSIPRRQRWCSRAWTFVAWLTLLPMLVAIILSGRRAAWLVVGLTPFIVFGLMQLARQRFPIRLWLALFALGSLVSVGALSHFGLEPSAIVREFMNAFDFAAEQSASVRAVQGEALFSGWEQRPMLGHGLGAGAHVVRSVDQPWAYELSYVALLYQTGLTGIFVFGAAVAWIFWAGIRTARRMPESATIILPLLAGLAGFLIANGTNPYLAKFDYLWVIFLPIAAINVYRLRARPNPVLQPAMA